MSSAKKQQNLLKTLQPTRS